jgi:hypothetical protein
MKAPRFRFIAALGFVALFGAIRLIPVKSDAQLAREKIETIRNIQALQNAMVDVYIQQLSRQTNE